MTIYDIPIHTLSGEPSSLEQLQGRDRAHRECRVQVRADSAVRGPRRAQKRYEARDFSVVGFPCNQFADQEPGTAEEIQTFCSTTYGVTFPLFEKIDVNGANQSPIYAELEKVADDEGYSGDIRWNFEKFFVGTRRHGDAFRPQVTPTTRS